MSFAFLNHLRNNQIVTKWEGEMKIKYGRTRSGKVVEVDWSLEGHKRIVQSYSVFEDWIDRVDALSIFEAFSIRGQRLLTQQDLAEEEGFNDIVDNLQSAMLGEVGQGQQTWTELNLSLDRLSHGRALLFSWYRNGW